MTMSPPGLGYRHFKRARLSSFLNMMLLITLCKLLRCRDDTLLVLAALINNFFLLS